ncbi:MAG: hypothetical protein VX026_04815 [Myxococcota bacterium]|nr:hypothetical protein [Myxococcota bacterium]
MSTAIAHFNEPYAWIARGLLERNWEDISLSPNAFPMQSGLGFSVDNLLQTGGQFGLKLIVLARDEMGWLDNDGAYEFYARHCQDHWNTQQILIYSKDTAFFQFIPFQNEQLMWLGSQIHEQIGTHIRTFVPQRRQGHTVSTASLSQIPDPKPILASAEWVGFLDRRLRMRMDLNTARQEGLILSPPPQPALHPNAPPPLTHQNTSIPVQSHPNINIAPPNMLGTPPPINKSMGISLGMGIANQQAGSSFAGNTQTIAMEKLSKPAIALRVVFFVGIAMGLIAMANVMTTFLMINQGTAVRNSSEYLLVIMTSLGVSAVCLVGSIFCHFGLHYYKEAKEHPLAYAPIVYACLLPFCNFFGTFIIGMWALWMWYRPEVKAARKKES